MRRLRGIEAEAPRDLVQLVLGLGGPVHRALRLHLGRRDGLAGGTQGRLHLRLLARACTQLLGDLGARGALLGELRLELSAARGGRLRGQLDRIRETSCERSERAI